MIDELTLTNFRCFKDLKISFSPGINLITGINGSGKTSILESLYLLGRGRSFRTNFLSDLILKNQTSAVAFLKGSFSKEQKYRIGCEIKKSSLALRVNNEPVKQRSMLLDFLPLQIITPSSHELIDSGPTYRRKFIDWGLFHVEQSYRIYWSNFRRVLKQRNQLLKDGNPDLKHWDQEFIKYANILSDFRSKYFSELSPFFAKVQENLLGEKVVNIQFFPGWNPELELEDALSRSFSKDKLFGWSNLGPHKADIKLSFKKSSRNILSRGQQKLLVFSLQIAQCLHLMDHKSQLPLLLIDDISSELDHVNLNKLFEFIECTNLQTVVSIIEAEKIKKEFFSNMFHVEQQTS